ncbi:MAG: serine protease [Candidatus Omnitrophica bacterium]|nr:serine protease [Candidatus Omnitrophota bacterium]
MFALLLAIAVLFFPAWCLPAHGRSSILFESNTNVQAALVAIKAVDAKKVYVKNGRKILAAEERLGQGIIIDPSGIILTNTHILGMAKHILVTLDSKEILEASFLYSGTDDFSFLKITAPKPLRAIPWTDFARIAPGDPVIAFNNKQHVLGGTISRLIQEKSSDRIEFLELDVNLEHGDSGGPILDEQGCLLGLIMARRESNEHKSLAISSAMIRQSYLHHNGSVLVGEESPPPQELPLLPEQPERSEQK